MYSTHRRKENVSATKMKEKKHETLQQLRQHILLVFGISQTLFAYAYLRAMSEYSITQGNAVLGHDLPC